MKTIFCFRDRNWDEHRARRSFLATQRILARTRKAHASFYYCSDSCFYFLLFLLFCLHSCFCITLLCPAASNTLARDLYAALGSPKNFHAVHQGQNQGRVNVPYVNSIAHFSKHVPNPLHPICGWCGTSIYIYMRRFVKGPATPNIATATW